MLGAFHLSSETRHVSIFWELAAWASLVWYFIVWIVCGIGYTQLVRHFSRAPPPAQCVTGLPEDEVPHVTIVRPVKGLEPRLYECLASTFLQTYPKSKLTIYLCVSERTDPSLPILHRLVRDFPDVDAKVFIEEDDPLLERQREPDENNGDTEDGDSGEESSRGMVKLGPNPKIRNMSRAYREAKGDIIWIIDCNVWVGKGVCGRLVDLLCGFNGRCPYKFVHQLPMVIDLDSEAIDEMDRRKLLGGDVSQSNAAYQASSSPSGSKWKRLWHRSGGRLDEMFMSSAHAKFYLAINTVAVAPCILGKSNMFRRSHLNYVTSSNPERAPGIDFFSDNICEDHLIGDALWKKPQAFEIPVNRRKSTTANGAPKGKKRITKPTTNEGVKYGKHAMLFGDMCFQPVSHTSVPACTARRVRWLRVRKFTVTLATLVEPGTESIVHGLYGAFAITTLPFFEEKWSIPQSWTSFFVFWLLSVAIWCAVDWTQYRLLHSAKSIEIDKDTPDFVLPSSSINPSHSSPSSPESSRQPLLNKNKFNVHEDRRQNGISNKRTFFQWWFAWLGREILAFPIWMWAFWGGVTVSWRGRRFWGGLDMKVHEIHDAKEKDKGKGKKKKNGD